VSCVTLALKKKFIRLDGFTCHKIVTFLSTESSVTIILKKGALYCKTLTHNAVKLSQKLSVKLQYRNTNIQIRAFVRIIPPPQLPPPQKNPIMLYLQNTEAGKFIIPTVQNYRGQGCCNKGAKRGGGGRRKRQVISWVGRGSSSFLDCVVAVSG
jgi:hypothetical protein